RTSPDANRRTSHRDLARRGGSATDLRRCSYPHLTKSCRRQPRHDRSLAVGCEAQNLLAVLLVKNRSPSRRHEHAEQGEPKPDFGKLAIGPEIKSCDAYHSRVACEPEHRSPAVCNRP